MGIQNDNTILIIAWWFKIISACDLTIIFFGFNSAMLKYIYPHNRIKLKTYRHSTYNNPVLENIVH